MSVVVESQYNSAVAVTNYTGILAAGQGGNPGWGQAATALYAPTVKRAYNGKTTDLYLTNVGPANTTITIRYYDDNGN